RARRPPHAQRAFVGLPRLRGADRRLLHAAHLRRVPGRERPRAERPRAVDPERRLRAGHGAPALARAPRVRMSDLAARGALPPGFAQGQAPGLRFAADAALRPALEAAGRLDAAGGRAPLADAAGARGRAPSAVVPLPDGLGQVALRSVRHGGWLGPLLGRALATSERPFAELGVTARLRAAGAPV